MSALSVLERQRPMDGAACELTASADQKPRSIEVYSLTRGAYALHGEYGPGEQLTSELLPGLELLTDTVFTA